MTRYRGRFGLRVGMACVAAVILGGMPQARGQMRIPSGVEGFVPDQPDIGPGRNYPWRGYEFPPDLDFDPIGEYRLLLEEWEEDELPPYTPFMDDEGLLGDTLETEEEAGTLEEMFQSPGEVANPRIRRTPPPIPPPPPVEDGDTDDALDFWWEDSPAEEREEARSAYGGRRYRTLGR